MMNFNKSLEQSKKLLLPLTASSFVLSLALSSLSANAVVISFPDFSTSTGLTLNGSSSVNVNNGVDTNPVLRLTRAVGSQSGSVFSTTSLNAATFSSFFEFRITDPGGGSDGTNTGADGITFTIQSVSASSGGGGGGIGYSGISNSVAVEFDTWNNGWDPDSNHLGIDTNGNIASLNTVSIPTRFDDGNLWSAWIDYNGTTLEARVNQTGVRPLAATISATIDIAVILGSTTAFVGFTSGTGSAWGNHDIVSWEYRDSFDPIDPPPGNVPLPSTLLLLGLGLAGFGFRLRRSS